MNEPIYYILDYTDKETIYFDTLEEVNDYIATWNHTMVICRRTLSSWQEIDYIERED